MSYQLMQPNLNCEIISTNHQLSTFGRSKQIEIRYQRYPFKNSPKFSFETTFAPAL